MKVLLVGGGGREHAMALALATDPSVEIVAAPGNPGIAAVATTVPVAVDDLAGLVALARTEGVDLVVPGPEIPLVGGLGDALADAGIPCAGPTAAAALLEGSKAFTRLLADDAGVPSPHYRIVDRPADIEAAVAAFEAPPVVKADGLAAGKGVLLPDTHAECADVTLEILDGRFGPAGGKVVLEERLTGIEASLFFACRGDRVIVLPHARDHKRLLAGDRGPNTGGMGALSPSPIVDDALIETAVATMVRPTLEALDARGSPFAGFLFAGLMLTDDGPRLLEFNVRLGDPEAQAVLPRLGPGVFAQVCRWVAGLEDAPPIVEEDPRPVCAVVLASAGYPDDPRRGDAITVHPDLATPDRWLVHAGTRLAEGDLVTDGGRVAAVVARGDTAEGARSAAYEGVSLVRWEGMMYRTDIGGGDDG